MQEQEKEALNAEILYQIIKDHAEQGKQKKFKVLFGVLASLWAFIFAPFIVFIMQNSYTSQKWPVIIRISIFQPGSVEAFFVLSGTLFWFWVLWRFLTPYRCDEPCPYITWSAKSMMRHIKMRHINKKHAEIEYNEKNEGMFWRILYILHHPFFRCQCGYFTWSKKKMLLHLEAHAHITQRVPGDGPITQGSL